MSAFTFDDKMIVCARIASLARHESPILHLRRCQEGGLFNRYAYHAGELWKRPPTAHDVAVYLGS